MLANDYFLPMAERAFGIAARTETEVNAVRLAQWLKANPRERIVGRELYSGGPLRGVPANDVDAACMELVEAGWLTPDFARQGATAGRMQKAYRVNPSL